MHTRKVSQDPVWKIGEDQGVGGSNRNLNIDLEIPRSVGNFVALPIHSQEKMAT